MGGCLGIIVIFLAVVGLAMYVAGVIIAIDVAVLILFLGSIASYNRAKKMRASTMICPNCRSMDVKLSLLKDGTTANTHHYQRSSQRVSTIRYKRMANCQSCGFAWDFITQDEIYNEIESSKKRIYVFFLLLIICLSFTASVFDRDDSETTNVENEKILEDIEQQEDESEKVGSEQVESHSIWLDGYTDINQFDYYIDGNEIYVKKYNGDAEKIRLASSYDIDGEEMHIVSFSDATFLFASAESIIIPEGTISLDNATFNSCGAKFVYLPSTLEKPEESFWNYFHDVEKIYYGGSEEEWNEICTVERSEIEVKRIIYDADPDELK